MCVVSVSQFYVVFVPVSMGCQSERKGALSAQPCGNSSHLIVSGFIVTGSPCPIVQRLKAGLSSDSGESVTE